MDTKTAAQLVGYVTERHGIIPLIPPNIGAPGRTV